MSSAEWNVLGSAYFRKVDIYEMLWDEMRLDDFTVAIAHYGGPIAMVRDPRQSQHHSSSSSSSSSADHKLRIYTSSGSLLSTVAWEHREVLVSMAWNSAEQLVCVFADGSIVVYSLHGERVSHLSLPPACKKDGVAECVMWLDGLVARTSNSNELYSLINYAEPRMTKLADTGLPTPPTSLAVLGGARQTDLEVFVSTADGSLIVVDKKSAEDQLIDSGPFALSVVSPSGQLLAAFSEGGTLHVMSTDFTRHLCQYDTRSKPPKQMVWCGEGAVVMHWDGILLLVGMGGDFVKYSYDGPLLLCSESDGVRIITNTTHEWLHVVHESMESVFKVGSVTPAARLFDAQEAFEQHHGNAAEYLRLIDEEDARLRREAEAADAAADKKAKKLGPKPALRSAIDACLTAAAHEFSPQTQQQLLKAAAYGKLFASQYPADKFVDMCRILRVLNAIRHPSIGIPLTYTQYQTLEAECIIDRLTARYEYLLAIRICQYLKMDVDKVIVHWACTKIKASDSDDDADEDDAAGATAGGGGGKRSARLSDEKLGEMIISKLMLLPGISYAPIATTAFRYGRRALAVMVLEYEPLAENQVPLLLSMKEDELALDKAIASGDTDLVYMCILHCHKTRQQKDFFALVKDRPLARQLYIAFCKQTDLPALKAFYYFLQHNVDAANVAVLQAYACSDYKDRVGLLKLALEFYEKDKSSAFTAKATEEQLRLLEIEKEQELTQHAANPADSCVPEHDTRVLTDAGFLFLSEVEARIASGERVLYACYEESTKSIVYKPGKLKYAAPPTHWVDFTQAGTRRLWDDDSDDYGSAKVSADDGRANRLTLRTTPQHEMFVQLCTVGCAKGRTYEPRMAGGAAIPPHKMTARELAPGYQCDCVAAGRTCTHGYSHYRMYTGAADGLKTPADVISLTDRDEQSPVAALDLRTADELDAFLELFGYWLGDGSMDYRRPGAGGYNAVTFSPRKERDRPYLFGLLARLHLVRGQHFAGCDVDVGRSLRVIIHDERWFKYFDDGFGVKYQHSRHHNKRGHHLQVVPPDYRGKPRPVWPVQPVQLAPSVQLERLMAELYDDPQVANGGAETPTTDGEDEGAVVDDEDEDDLVKSAQWMPHWALHRLDKRQLRLVIEGLRQADGRSAPSMAQSDAAAAGGNWMFGLHVICTSSLGFRDQLVQACLHAGYSAYFSLNTRADEVRGYSTPGDPTMYTPEEMEAALELDPERPFKPVCGNHDNWWVCYSENRSELLPAQDVRFDGSACRIRQKNALKQGWVAVPTGKGRVRRAATQRELAKQFSVHRTTIDSAHKRGTKVHGEWTILTDAQYEEQQSGQIRQQPQSAAIATKPGDLYDRERDGRVWCVEVEHDDHLIVVQRAHRDSRGVVTKVGRPMITGNCVDEPLAYLLKVHILAGDKKRVAKLQSTFKVSDVRLWHLQVRAFAQAGQWEELWKLVAESKKPPVIGYLPFIEACVEQKEYVEAARYIDRLADHRTQIEWLCAIGNWKEAADLAAKHRDMEALHMIRQSCRNQTVLEHIKELMQNMPRQ